MSAVADIRKLAERLAKRGAGGARLDAESAHRAMIALRVYADLLEAPAVEDLGHPYKIETLYADGDTHEVLSLRRNAMIAQAAFAEAVKQRPGRALRIRKGSQVIAETARQTPIAQPRRP